MLPDLQARFAESLTTAPGSPFDQALTDQLEESAIAKDERLAVYRNNVQISLIGVLRAAFPVTAELADSDNFTFAARRFLAEHPPSEARLLTYGAKFPGWLAAFTPAAKQPWLAEMARLEWALNEALFAADAEPLDPNILTQQDPAAVMSLRFAAHPATRLIESAYALHSLWRAREEGVDLPDPRRAAETVLVLRPDLQVTQLCLSRGEAQLAKTLLAGETLGVAAEAALTAEPTLDLQAALFRHLRHGSFSGCSSV
ncbi:MAG: DNA-binding domain-containing protein [Kiloniellales bacterium]